MSSFDKVMNSGWTAGAICIFTFLGLGYVSIDSATTIETAQAVPPTDPIFPPMQRCLKNRAGTLSGFELSRIDIVTKHSLLWGLSQETRVTVVKEGMSADRRNTIVFNAPSQGISIRDVTGSSGPDVILWDGGKIVAVAGIFNNCLHSAEATVNAMRDIQSLLKKPRPVVQFTRPVVQFRRTAGYGNSYSRG